MDLGNRQRHTHRSISRSRSDSKLDNGLSRSESVDMMRLARRNERLGISEEEGADGQALDAGSEMPALSILAETIEEQASSASEITHQLKVVLNQCLMMAIADTDSVFDPPGLNNQAQSPEELLKALAKIVSTTGGSNKGAGRIGLLDAGRQQAEEETETETEIESYSDYAPSEAIRSNAVAALVKKHRLRFVPAVTETPDGLRLEDFEDGSEITKDALGRVLEINSAVGENMSFQYDRDGNLEAFYRNDSAGRPHSSGKRDKHGVVVRDPGGRARAAGETMTVDPHGCLSIHNHDGQMVSLDLLRGLHIERRRLSDNSGHLSTVTAIFAHDGFRMATHFHDVIRIDGSGSTFNGDKISPMRFYGRDGSMVEFSSEDELLAVHPDKVLPPASMCVGTDWRGKRQARTAWESVQEYLELLL